MALPAGYRIEYGGEFENQQETFGEMRNALLISLVLIFLILLFQFRTLIDPLIVMAAFPLALPGAALGPAGYPQHLRLYGLHRHHQRGRAGGAEIPSS